MAGAEEGGVIHARDSRMTKSIQDIIALVQSEHAYHHPGNRRVMVEYQGRRMSLLKLHIETGIPHSTLTWRYRRGLRGAELIAPPDPKRTRKADRKVA